jgi:small subunit ribosomal protein S6
MRKYGTVFICDPDLQDQVREDLFEKVRNIITKENGLVLNFDEWGNKKLAYEIKKKLRGHYVCVTYGGTGALVMELERNFRLSDDVMKFMTILLSDDVTVEQLEQEAKEALEKSEPETEDADTEEAPEAETVEDNASEEDETVEETKEQE